MYESLVEVPKLRGTYKAKEAVLSHILPLAKWTLRPHGKRHLFCRQRPPRLLESVEEVRKPPRSPGAPLSPGQYVQSPTSPSRAAERSLSASSRAASCRSLQSP